MNGIQQRHTVLVRAILPLLADIFEHSLVYVALSRVRTLKDLQIVSLPNVERIGAPPDPLVARFYLVRSACTGFSVRACGQA